MLNLNPRAVCEIGENNISNALQAFVLLCTLSHFTSTVYIPSLRDMTNLHSLNTRDQDQIIVIAIVDVRFGR